MKSVRESSGCLGVQTGLMLLLGLVLSREVMYTIGFSAFWAIAVASSALTCYLGGGRAGRD